MQQKGLCCMKYPNSGLGAFLDISEKKALSRASKSKKKIEVNISYCLLHVVCFVALQGQADRFAQGQTVLCWWCRCRCRSHSGEWSFSYFLIINLFR